MKSFFYVNLSDITSNSCTFAVPLTAQSQTIQYLYKICTYIYDSTSQQITLD